MTNDFKTTGEYNQVKTKVKQMLDIASGRNPVPNFMLLDTEGTWIFVLPMNDAAISFGSWHISRLNIIDMIQFKVSTKMGKEKASEKIADFIFDLG